MNTATPLPWPEFSAGENTRTAFRSSFEHAPVPVARCNPQGFIVDMNPAFRKTMCHGIGRQHSLRLCEVAASQDREKIEALLRDLFAARGEAISVAATNARPDVGIVKWTAWRQAGHPGEPEHALVIAEPSQERAIDDTTLQSQRWEAVGRLAGGVVHDFNNLLTGVMLYCDLLLSSLDARDRRRRYASEIRSAAVQATGLVRQLLVFARPQATSARLLSVNEVAQAMRDLLTRLIGDNIDLDLRLDPELGVINIDPSQVQQILLNLILNARDALPNGGRITVETRNCRFQPVRGTMPAFPAPAFPCVLLMVSDNGQGMNAETRQRLFEPFFTTKNAGQGTGLGLTTVRSIVTTNRGLIHFDSEAGRGTRVMILLPRGFPSVDSNPSATSISDSGVPAPTHFQETKKEPLL